MQRAVVFATIFIAQLSFAQGLVSIEVIGPMEIADEEDASYSCIAHFEGGGMQEITVLADWSVEPADLATIDSGELVVGDALTDVWLRISGSWSFLDQTEHASLDVLVKNTTAKELAEFSWSEAQLQDYVWSLALDDDLVIVGTPAGVGAVHLFDVSDPLETVELAKVVPPEGDIVEGYGFRVAVCGSRALVSADTSDGSGAAYLYDISLPGQPVLVSRLMPDGDVASFGEAVALTESAAFVGGAASRDAWKVFGFDASSGAQISEMAPTDRGVFRVGSLAASGGTLIIGSPLSDDFGDGTGAAYVFDVSDPANPVELRKLLADDAQADNYFGFSVAIDGNMVAIGAPLDSDNGSSSGSAYVFDVATGEQLWKFKPNDGFWLDFFGWGVSIRGGLVLASSTEDDGEGGADYGSAYLFNGLTGEQLTKLRASDGETGDKLGIAVALGDGVAFVASALGGVAVQDSGSVYVFSGEVSCAPDMNGDGELNVLDFVTFQMAWVAELGAADCDGDGQFTIVDFVCFQVLFVEGCL